MKECNEVIKFFKKAFGETERGKLLMPEGKVGHAEVKFEGSVLMMAGENIKRGNRSSETTD